MALRKVIKRKVTDHDLGRLKWFFSQYEDITKYVDYEAIYDDLKENYPKIIEAYETFDEARDNAINTINNYYI
jgi:hypothetical protein